MTTEDKFWLAVNAYHEARGESEEGKVAVCHVVLNRTGTVKQVVLKPYQFSWHNDNFFPIIREYGAFLLCMQAVEVCIGQREEGFTLYDADHYHKDSVNPYWADDFELVTIIGRHKFYKS